MGVRTGGCNVVRAWAVAVGILGMAITLPEGPAEQRAEATNTQQFSFAPGGTIRLNKSYGDVFIEGWDQPQVEVTVVKSTSYFEPRMKEKTTRRLATVNVATERKSDTEVVITTTLPRRARWVPPGH